MRRRGLQGSCKSALKCRCR